MHAWSITAGAAAGKRLLGRALPRKVWRMGERNGKVPGGPLRFIIALAIVLMSVSLMPSPAAEAAEPEDVIRRSQTMEAEEREQFTRPPEYYTADDGTVYRLADWKMECIPGGVANRQVEKEIVYRAVEGAQVIPEQIPFRGEVAGQTAAGQLSLADLEQLNEAWSEEFCVPVTFHSYGAEVYELGEITVDAGENFPPSEQYAGELLRVLGLREKDYMVEGMYWDGEPYVDEGGEVCRNAVAVGKKRIADYRVMYTGQISLPLQETYRLETVYKLRHPAIAAEAPAQSETAAPSGVEEPLEHEEGTLWYWVRSGFVVTIAAGVFGILLGTAILLAVWRREERSRRKRLS